MEDAFFSGWNSLMRILVVGTLAYAVLVLFLRLSGKRTLSKMNAFDFVVTIAIGSTLATVLPFVVTWTSVRVAWVRKLVTGEPRLLVHRGNLLPEALRAARVTEDEVRAAVRATGLSTVADACVVVLETDGSTSVVPAARSKD